MRVEGWELLLADHIQDATNTPFAWGQHDCMLFALRWVLKATGRDLVTGLAGTYANEIEASMVIRRLGPSLADCVDTEFERVQVPYAQRGDLVMKDGAMGICFGRQSWQLTEEGLASVMTLDCTAAWRV